MRTTLQRWTILAGAMVILIGQVTTATAQVTATELAGNELSDYPFFEYVRAINENAPVRVAIDPTRFPDISGETCDIYVVAAKTAGAVDGRSVTDGRESLRSADGNVFRDDDSGKHLPDCRGIDAECRRRYRAGSRI